MTAHFVRAYAEVAVKQGIRFVVKPKTFFNQLQWSSNHWMIMVLFLALATVETQVGRHNQLYNAFATFLEHKWGVGFNFALWIITAARLSLLLAGAFAISMIVYAVGSIVGTKNSRRVLFRRLAVVFTVVLAGFTARHLQTFNPAFTYLSVALCAWGVILGYIAIREQFQLNHLETSLVSLFAVFMITTTWQVSNRYFESSVRNQMSSLAKKPAERIEPSQFRMGTDL